MTILSTRSKPRRSVVRAGLTSPDCLRVWRASPEDVLVQVRRTNDYVSISLTFEEAKELAALLIAAANEKTEAA